MRKSFNKKNLSEQIILYYMFLFLVIFIICIGTYLFSSRRQIKTIENNSLEYGIQIAHSNMKILTENANNCSKSIAYSDIIQKAFSGKEAIGYEEQVAVYEEIMQNIACFDGVSSVYLFDKAGNSYVAGEIAEVEVIRKRLMDYLYFENTFQEDEKSQSVSVMTTTYQGRDGRNRQMLSFVRQINDLNTMKNIGILVVNVPIEEVKEMIDMVCAQTGIELSLIDSENREILSSSDGGWIVQNNMDELTLPGKTNYSNIQKNNRRYKIGSMEEENHSWIIIGAIEKNSIMSDFQKSVIYSFIIVLLGIALCIIGASYITSKITRPLSNILKSMENVRNNRFERVPLIDTNYEIDNLQQRYNLMLDEIENLMTQKIEEQRLRKKYELSLLQEQIKPHFLYNTFDSVCALARMGKTEDVYTMMQALGQYYRGSLHKGQTLITIKEELKIVENYLIIQGYRYDDVFKAVYDVDKSVESYMTIKLILQPLVENAIYHGFRENDLYGTITIRAKDADDYIKLQVEDDGIGMKKEQLNELLNHAYNHQGKRFGLPGTIQRINLYYNHKENNLVDIESEYGKGTRITIWIPKKGADEDAECHDYR